MKRLTIALAILLPILASSKETTQAPAQGFSKWIAEEFEDEPSDVVLHEPFPEEASEREKRKRTRKPDQRLVWEYWNGTRWVDLKPRDGTYNLTRSGTVEFRGPADFTAKQEFAEELYWLRCRMEMGSYARAPKIEDLLLNTVSVVHATALLNMPGCPVLKGGAQGRKEGAKAKCGAISAASSAPE